MRNEKTLKSQNDEMGQKLQHLELKVSHQSEEADVSSDVSALITACDEKADWIDILIRKLAEKDQQLESLLDISKEVILLCDKEEIKKILEKALSKDKETDDDSDEEADVEETGISYEKDVWIDRLTRKLAEKDTQLASLLDISKDTITSLASLLGSSTDTHEEETDDDSDDDSDEEEDDEHISVDMGPLVKGKDPCAKSVCTGSPICCNCCENMCCRCSRSKEWSKFPSGTMVPPKWVSKKPRTEEEIGRERGDQMPENELEGNDPCIGPAPEYTQCCCVCCPKGCCRCDRYK